MAKLSQYRYEVVLKLIGAGKPEEIPFEGIKSIVINYDYDHRHMPIIYISLNIMTSLYSKLVKGIDTCTLNLSIKKFNTNSTSAAKKTYVSSQFLYFLPDTEQNQTEDLDMPLEDEDASVPYKEATIGLLDKKLVTNNKMDINRICKNVNMITLAHEITLHMGPMVIEPFDNNEPIGTVIIPPLQSVAQCLRTFNKRKAFYKTSYRYFQDFKIAYILSSRPKGIDIGDGQYVNVIFEIESSNGTERAQQTTGLVIDSENEAYLFYVDAANAKVIKNRGIEKNTTKIVGVTTGGSINNQQLTVNQTTPGTRYKFERMPYENASYQDTLAGELETNVDQVLVTLTEIDSSLITPNKKYSIKTYEGASDYVGDYVLSQKKDIFLKQDYGFNLQTAITVRRKSKK